MVGQCLDREFDFLETDEMSDRIGKFIENAARRSKELYDEADLECEDDEEEEEEPVEATMV